VSNTLVDMPVVVDGPIKLVVGLDIVVRIVYRLVFFVVVVFPIARLVLLVVLIFVLIVVFLDVLLVVARLVLPIVLLVMLARLVLGCGLGFLVFIVVARPVGRLVVWLST
jgi:hypothetical protein